MAYPTIFANLTAGNQPLALFDTMFNIVAQMVAIPTLASGQNIIALTPIGNAPTLSGYTRFNTFTFKAVATSSAPVTASFASLASLPVYKSDGTTQVAANDILTGGLYLLIYDSGLNSGGGGFYLSIPTVSLTTPAVGGSISNLRIANNGVTPDTQIDVTVAEVIMVNPSTGASVRATSQNFTINAAAAGVVNGLDGGSLAASTWYYVWAISNGATTGGLLSLSSTAPTLPAGYTYQKRLGAVRTDVVGGQSGVVTISNASPGVISGAPAAVQIGWPITFTTTGALPTGLSVGTTYYVISAGFVSGTTLEVAATPNGAAINTSSAGSGVHTIVAAAARFVRTIQLDNQAQYTIAASGSPTLFPPIIASGAAGTYSTTNPVLASVSVASVVPPTAQSIQFAYFSQYQGSANSTLLVAPNTGWGGTARGPAGAQGVVWPVSAAGAEINMGNPASLMLETTSIAWASSAAGGALACLGWTDNL